MKPHALPATLVALALGAACGGDDLAGGALSVRVHGEAFAEEGIPADVFVDGWAVTFDRVLIALGDVTAAAGHEPVALEAPEVRIWDLAASSGGAGFEVASAEVPGGAYDHIAFRVAPAADATAGNASAEDVELMTGGGLSLYVEGAAERGGERKSFRWGFSGATSYRHCEGTAVIDGGPATTTLTMHLDHLFYDDLVAAEPNVAFDLIAAADDAGDRDGEVTALELAAVDLATEERYQVGSTGVEDLWSFIDHQTATIGHIDGEGHCGEAERE
ncbi:MAG TPA: hypothetical protein VKZ63_10345 [Kofleriaceae bacterium]|nr:hypothetical protein [Kofleriaceae bacterium]